MNIKFSLQVLFNCNCDYSLFSFLDNFVLKTHQTFTSYKRRYLEIYRMKRERKQVKLRTGYRTGAFASEWISYYYQSHPKVYPVILRFRGIGLYLRRIDLQFHPTVPAVHQSNLRSVLAFYKNFTLNSLILHTNLLSVLSELTLDIGESC